MSDETNQPRRRRSIQQQLAALAQRIDTEKQVRAQIEAKLREQDIRIMTMEEMARDFAAVDGGLQITTNDTIEADLRASLAVVK